MRRIVRTSDPTDSRRGWIGVIKAADQIVNPVAGWIDQNDLTSAAFRVDPHPVLPLLSAPSSRVSAQFPGCSLDLQSGKGEQTLSAGACSTSDAVPLSWCRSRHRRHSRSVLGREALAEGQKSGQIAGVIGRGEHQCEIGIATTTGSLLLNCLSSDGWVDRAVRPSAVGGSSEPVEWRNEAMIGPYQP